MLNDVAHVGKRSRAGWIVRRPILAAMVIVFLVVFGLLAAYLIYGFFFFSFDRPPRVQEIGLADLTGNGYLDAYLAIGPGGEPYQHPDYVLFNDGDGRFIDSGQDIGNWDSSAVRMGDINGDGSVDAVVSLGQVVVYINYGDGVFTGGHYGVGAHGLGTGRGGIALGDLNGDGHLDIYLAACCGGGTAPADGRERQVFLPEDRVYLNRGDGHFLGGPSLAVTGSNAVALGDLNGNGALDAFVVGGFSMNADGSTTQMTPNTVWFNDGQGNFTDSGQRLGQKTSITVALGDLNGNGHLDAVVGNWGQDEIWLNDGLGNFRLAGQRVGREMTRFVFLGDLNGNGHLDIFIGDDREGQVWFNDGQGNFTAGDQAITYERYDGVTLGDVTGDGWVDIFVAGVDAYQVWRNEGQGRFNADPRTKYR
jgi:hypothetical protein